MRSIYVNLRVALPILALPLLVLLTGCSKSKGPALAVVNGERITIDDLKSFYKYPPASQRFATAQREYNAKRDALDSMIIMRLLVHEAYDKGMEDLADVNRVVTANYDRFLINALYQTAIADKINVTDADIRNFYEKQKTRVRAEHILVNTEAEADSLLDSLKAGADFEELAYKYSTDPSAKRNRGDLGYFTYGFMVQEFDDAVSAMQPGEISPPVKSPYGYHIIKLIDRAPSDFNQTYEEAKDKIKRQIENRLQYRLTTEFYLAMKEKYPVTIDTTVADYPLHKREQLYPPALISSVPRNDFDEDQLDRDEKALVLATWEGGKMTLGDYILAARNTYPPSVKPDFDNYDSLATIVFDLNKTDILAAEARSRGLQNSDFFKNKVKQIREYTMADILRNDSIAPPVKPTEEQLRSYFDSHTEDYAVPAAVHVFEIQLKDELKARQVAKQIKTFNEFKAKAEQLTTRKGYAEKQGDLGYVGEQYFPEIFEAAYDAKPGSILGPIRFQGKYSVIYKVESAPKRYQDYLEVKDQIGKALEKDVRDSTFKAWVDAHEKDADITINDDLLWETVNKQQYSSVPTSDATKNP